MKENFLPYAEALLLGELEFKEDCLGFFWGETLQTTKLQEVTSSEIEQLNAIEGNNTYLLAPLWQQAFYWFRKKHGLSAIISQFGWAIENEYGTLMLHSPEEETVLSFEDSQLSCLRNLINITKDNKSA